MLTANLRKGETYIVVPTSTGCKFKQYATAATSSSSNSESTSRDVVLYIHSEEALRLEEFKGNSRRVVDKAFELAIRGGGFITDIVEDAIQMYSLRGGNAGISYAAENTCRAPIRLTTDFAQESVNICSHRGSLVNSFIIAPGKNFKFR